jgi:seryl-tRNA synthetase
MVLDIELFRQTPEKVRDSQVKRCKGLDGVNKVIELDTQWRTLRYQADQWNRLKKICGRTVGSKKQANENEGDSEDLPGDLKINLDTLNAEVIEKLNIKQIKRLSRLLDTEVENTEEQLIKVEKDRNSTLHEIGNIVHESVPVSDNEVKRDTKNLFISMEIYLFRIIILLNELLEMLKHEKNILILI